MVGSNGNHYLANRRTLTEAKSVEVLPCPSPSLIVPVKSKKCKQDNLSRKGTTVVIVVLIVRKCNIFERSIDVCLVDAQTRVIHFACLCQHFIAVKCGICK